MTDYAWADLDLEREILQEVDAEILEAENGEEEELLSLAGSVDGILTCWKAVSGAVMRRAARCQSVGRYGIGLDNIDVSTATELGILVTNVPAYCLDEVSDHALALLLACVRKVGLYDRAIKNGQYDLSLGMPMFRLAGKTLGIVGLGKIGRRVAAKAQAFGLRIVAFDPLLSSGATETMDVTAVSLDRLLAESDLISIHAPLTEETDKMFDADAFRRMKKTAFLVNTSRGGIVDTDALRVALDQGLLAGAALDVLAQEPPSSGDALLSHPKVILTPHAAFYSEESLQELRATAARQMAGVLLGKTPENIVNAEVLRQPNLRAHLEDRNG